MNSPATQTIFNWARDFGQTNYENPIPQATIVVELDKFSHLLESKKQAMALESMMTVIVADSSNGS